MTNRVTLTIHIDLPDGVVPDVAYGTVPQIVVADEPFPDPVEMAPFPPFPSQASSPPFCRVHKKAMKAGKSGGWYCSAKVGPGEKDWCTERIAA